MNVEEIEREVSQLPIKDINKFSQWFEEFVSVHPPAFSWERGHLGRHFSGRDARAPRGSERLQEFKADLWDKQIEEDILAGRLDALAKHVDEEFLAGHATPL